MDITEVRRRFAAYGAGELTETELRSTIRHALTEQPLLSSAYVALTEACRRANIIDPELHSTIIADITEITGPRPDPAPSRVPVQPDDDGRTVFSPRGRERAAASPQEPSEGFAAEGQGRPSDGRDRFAPNAPEPKAGLREPLGNADASPAGSASAVSATADPSGRTGPGGATGAGSTTGSTTGSAWDSPERLAEVAAPLSLGSVLKGRFELVEELGRGGMGVVYKALDRRSGDGKDRRYVALKVLNEEFKRHPLAVRSLQREARKAQKLAHPNIVTVFDFDRDGGNVFMVMELLSGRGLDEVIRDRGHGGLPTQRALEIVKALGAALSYAHEQGIVHCDFKPSNAFITEQGVVKVLDFGIARAAPVRAERGEKTIFDAGQLGAISPPYASLEMLNHEEPDVRDDVYALACVSYELLTGRHPFNRIDAAKAQATGLQPIPVRTLARSQWQALRQGLAFTRADRTATVDAFVSQLVERPRRTAWWVVAASLAAIGIAIAVIVPGQWEAHQARELSQALTTAHAGTFSGALARLKAAPARLRERVLLDDSTRAALIAHFRAAMQKLIAAPGYDYPRASAMLGELEKLLPDSSEVTTLRKQLGADQQAVLRGQIERRDRLLAQDILVPTQGADNATAALERIRRIDPDNQALVDPRVTSAYLAAGTAALSTGRPALAKEIAEAALTFTNDTRLADLKDRARAEITRSANLRRAAELERKVAALDPRTPGFLDEVLASRDDVSALATAAPNSPALARLQASLQGVVLQKIKQQLVEHDIAGARALLLNVGELLPAQVVAGARASVAAAARVEEDRDLDLLDRVRTAVLTGRLGQRGTSGALEVYQEIQASGASPAMLAEARDLLAYGHLRLARRARTAGDSASALKDLTDGQGLQASTVLQQRLAAERALLGQGAQGAADRTRLSELDSARQHFAESLRSATLEASQLAVMAEALDRLEALGSSAQEIDSGLRQIEDRVIGEVARLQQQSGMEAAQLFARQASATVLGSERIAEVARQLRHSAVRSSGFAPEILAVRNELTDTIAKPEVSPAWANSVQRLIQKLGAVVPADDPAIADARRVASATFTRSAASAREHKRYSEAANLLATAREFDPQSAELARETAALAHDRETVAQEAAIEEQHVGIEALKRKLTDQVAAGDLAAANTTANALRRVLGGSVYASRELPQILTDGYAQLAKTQLAAGHVDVALETLASGRKKFGSSPQLKNLEARYVAVGDLYDRLSTAVKLNAGEQRRSLEALRVAEGPDFPVIERMLARTLANRIADQRAVERPAVAANLLEAGREIFPGYAAALEQGTAGALPKTGIPVTVDEPNR